MARSLTPRDCHALINLVVKEATGQDGSIQAVDSSTFVAVGEQLLNLGQENVLNALSLVLGRTFVAVRPYNAKLNILNKITSDEYASRLRKISFYSREAQASGDFNTQSYTNLAMGYDNGTNSNNSTPSMWEQNQAIPLELDFSGSSVWEDSTTVYEYQLKQAFRSEADFAQFVSGIMTEKGNDLESQKEAFNRMTLLNYIGGLYDLGAGGIISGSHRNMTAEYNAKFGTSYTTAQLLSTYLKEFLEFFVSEVKKTSDWITNRSALRHWSPAKTINGVSYKLLRHTPKDRQKLLLYSPLMTEAEARIMPEIFNPEYLSLDNYEGVEFWQNQNDPMGVDVIPAIPDSVNTGFPTIAGAEVKDIKVLGVLFDEDALMTQFMLDRSYTTPLEARKAYRNIWWSYMKNAICDFTENGVLFYMEDPATP